MRYFLFLVWLTVFMPLVLAEEAPQVTFLSEDEISEHAEDIKKVEEYLTRLTSIVADFTQIAPDGSISTGKFFLKRPGKMRWQYNPPTPVLIVTDGNQLVFFDRELEQVNYIPLEESLIGFMAKKEIRFDETVGITAFEHENGVIRVTLAERSKPSEGSLMLELTDRPLLIRNMVVRDATNQMTSVSLENAAFGPKLDDNLFVFRDPRKPRKR